MYKTRLAFWGFSKNVTKKDWQIFATMRQQREASGEPFTRVEIHKKIKSEKDFRGYLKLQNVSEEDFVREALASSMRVPSDICYRDSTSPIVAAPSIAVSGSPRITHPDQNQQVETDQEAESIYPGLMVGKFNSMSSAVNPTGCSASPSNVMQYETTSSGSDNTKQTDQKRAFVFQGHVPFHGPAAHVTTADRNPGSLWHAPPDWTNPVSSAPYGMVLPNYLSQVVEPEAGVMPVGPPYSDFGGMLGQILRPESQKTAVDSVSDETEAHQAFKSDSMMACISLASKKISFCYHWLEKASMGLRHMCSSRDRMLLVTLSTILVWLQVHDQDSSDGSRGTAEALMEEFSSVAIDELGEHASLCVILQWMTAVAGKNLAGCQISSKILQQVWVEYTNVLGFLHPNTIVALYCLGQNMMNVDRCYADAESHLRWAHEAAVKVFGVSHPLSLNVLATLSRAQLRQGNLAGALDNIQKCVKEEPWGQNHPHRLMLLLRMAVIYHRLGKFEQRDKLYWIVVEGRAATLGPRHSSTKSAYNSLVGILQEAGKWESAKEQVEKLLSEPHVAVSRYETWWLHQVEQARHSQEPRSMSEVPE